jgi:hypothetical protein
VTAGAQSYGEPYGEGWGYRFASIDTGSGHLDVELAVHGGTPAISIIDDDDGGGDPVHFDAETSTLLIEKLHELRRRAGWER